MSAPTAETHYGLTQHNWDETHTFIGFFFTFKEAGDRADELYAADEADGVDDQTITHFDIDHPHYGESFK